MYNVVPTTVWISKKLVTSRFGISRDANCGLNTFTDNALQIEIELRQLIFDDIRINNRGIKHHTVTRIKTSCVVEKENKKNADAEKSARDDRYCLPVADQTMQRCIIIQDVMFREWPQTQPLTQSASFVTLHTGRTHRFFFVSRCFISTGPKSQFSPSYLCDYFPFAP